MASTRRKFLTGLGALAPQRYIAATQVAASTLPRADYYAELGIKPFVNAIGPYSSLGGAEMWPEVIAAMDYAIKTKVRMEDLHDAVGARIATLTGSEAAMVSSGATGAMILGTAACMTLGDEQKMEELPDARNMPNEVIILKRQRYLYDRSIRAPGAQLVEVETVADIRAAVSSKTAMMFYLLNRPQEANIDPQEYIAVANELNVPIFCDAATTVPPVGNIKKTVAMGFDLICYSGGKGLRGPYSAGLLLGRKDLIHFARQNGSPHHRAYGRSMKVAAEEYLGMMVAVEKSFEFDEDAEYRRQSSIVSAMGRDLERIPGVTTVLAVPDGEAREPYIEVHWDKVTYNIEVATLKQALRAGDPSIEVRALFLSNQQLHLTAVALKEGEAQIVTNRIRDILLQHENVDA